MSKEVYGMAIDLDKQIEKARLEREGEVPAYDGDKKQWVSKGDLPGLPTWKMPRQN